MISNRCARKSLVTNCNSIISKNYLRFLVDSNDLNYECFCSNFWISEKLTRTKVLILFHKPVVSCAKVVVLTCLPGYSRQD